MRLRGGGGVPGPKYNGKVSTEMRQRSESILESIRTPKTVVNPISQWRIIRGDYVEVISGPECGKRGRVLEVVRSSNRVVIEGIGYVTKFVPQLSGQRKKAVRTEAPIYVSRVAVICPKTDRPTRVRYQFMEDGTKVRVAVVSGMIIPRPDVLKIRRVPRSHDTPKDTPPSVVLQRTYEDERGLYDAVDGGFQGAVHIATSDKPGSTT